MLVTADLIRKANAAMADIALTTAIHELLSRLPRFDFQARSDQLPSNGIEIFCERGERIEGRNSVECTVCGRRTSNSSPIRDACETGEGFYGPKSASSGSPSQ
jgi:hypothetical protein